MKMRKNKSKKVFLPKETLLDKKVVTSLSIGNDSNVNLNVKDQVIDSSGSVDPLGQNQIDTKLETVKMSSEIAVVPTPVNAMLTGVMSTDNTIESVVEVPNTFSVGMSVSYPEIKFGNIFDLPIYTTNVPVERRYISILCNNTLLRIKDFGTMSELIQNLVNKVLELEQVYDKIFVDVAEGTPILKLDGKKQVPYLNFKNEMQYYDNLIYYADLVDAANTYSVNQNMLMANQVTSKRERENVRTRFAYAIDARSRGINVLFQKANNGIPRGFFVAGLLNVVDVRAIMGVVTLGYNIPRIRDTEFDDVYYHSRSYCLDLNRDILWRRLIFTNYYLHKSVLTQMQNDLQSIVSKSISYTVIEANIILSHLTNTKVGISRRTNMDSAFLNNIQHGDPSVFVSTIIRLYSDPYVQISIDDYDPNSYDNWVIFIELMLFMYMFLPAVVDQDLAVKLTYSACTFVARRAGLQNSMNSDVREFLGTVPMSNGFLNIINDWATYGNGDRLTREAYIVQLYSARMASAASIYWGGMGSYRPFRLNLGDINVVKNLFDTFTNDMIYQGPIYGPSMIDYTEGTVRASRFLTLILTPNGLASTSTVSQLVSTIETINQAIVFPNVIPIYSRNEYMSYKLGYTLSFCTYTLSRYVQNIKYDFSDLYLKWLVNDYWFSRLSAIIDLLMRADDFAVIISGMDVPLNTYYKPHVLFRMALDMLGTEDCLVYRALKHVNLLRVDVPVDSYLEQPGNSLVDRIRANYINDRGVGAHFEVLSNAARFVFDQNNLQLMGIFNQLEIGKLNFSATANPETIVKTVSDLPSLIINERNELVNYGSMSMKRRIYNSFIDYNIVVNTFIRISVKEVVTPSVTQSTYLSEFYKLQRLLTTSSIELRVHNLVIEFGRPLHTANENSFSRLSYQDSRIEYVRGWYNYYFYNDYGAQGLFIIFNPEIVISDYHLEKLVDVTGEYFKAYNNSPFANGESLDYLSIDYIGNSI